MFQPAFKHQVLIEERTSSVVFQAFVALVGKHLLHKCTCTVGVILAVILCQNDFGRCPGTILVEHTAVIAVQCVSLYTVYCSYGLFEE